MKTQLKTLLAIFLLHADYSYGQSIKDSSKVIELNNSIMDCVYNNTDKAKSIGFKSLELSRRIGYSKGEGIALSRIGIAYDVESHFDSAIYYYNLALKTNKKIGYKKGIGSAYCNLGLAYLNKNDYPNALGYLHKAIPPLREIKEHLYLGNCYNNIGLLFLEMDNYKKAREYFLLAKDEFEKSGNINQQAFVISNLAMIFSETKKFDSAISMEQEAIKYYEKVDDYYNLAKSYNNIGIDYVLLNDYQKGIDNYLMSAKYAEKFNSKSGKADTYANLATAYSMLNDYKNSEKYANMALEMVPFIRSRKIKSDLFYLYANLKRRQGEYKIASEYFHKAKWQKDSFFKLESAEIISKAEARFGLERKESENRELMNQNKIQQLELKNKANEVKFRKRVNNLIIVGSLLIIFFIFMIVRRRMQLNRLIAENRLKSEQQNQRVQISHELHDNVGAQLSYIVSNLDVLQENNPEDKRLRSITEMSKQAIVTLRETVWALNNESISITDFSDKFKQYTSKLLAFNPDVQCHFKEHIVFDQVLQPLQALNFFRICQEAFSNALHHAKARNIRISFENNESTLFEVVIEDDGIGFDEEEASLKGHYGLITMRTRAEELGAKFSIMSKKGEGTRVSFVLGQ